jgi:TolA-binding protein
MPPEPLPYGRGSDKTAIALLALILTSSAIAQTNPSPAAATKLLQEASRLQNDGKYAEATAKWQAFLRDYPSDSAAGLVYQGLGACLLEMGDWQASIEALQEALKRLPKGESGHNVRWNLAVAMFRRAEKSKIADHRKQVERALEDVLADKETAKDRQGLATFYLARLAEEAKDWTKSTDRYRAFLRDFANHPSAPEARLGLADALFQAGTYQEADTVFGELVNAQNPIGGDYAYFRWAETAELRGERQIAAERWVTFLEKHAKSNLRERAQLHAAKLNYQLKQFPAAEKFYVELINGPQALSAGEALLLEAVTSAFAASDPLRGLAWTNRMVERFAKSPETSQAQLLAARYQTENGQYEAAGHRSRWLLDSKVPDVQSAALYLAGFSAMKLRKFDEAITHFQALRDQFPKAEQTPVAVYSIGVAYESQGAIAKALTAYRDFLKRYGEHSLAGEARKRALVLENGG